MTYQAKLITGYRFQSSDLLLLDANVWFYIYGPTIPQNRQTAIYSTALRDILLARSQIFIDVLIISEFINRYARLEHQLLSKSDPGVTPNDFKIFRQSSAFTSIAKVIAANVKRILSISQRIESNFIMCDIVSVLDEYTKGKSDFNDLMLTQICQDKGLKLVTHDGDFKGKNLSVLTANKNLIPGK